jgi:hypothetical protein
VCPRLPPCVLPLTPRVNTAGNLGRAEILSALRPPQELPCAPAFHRACSLWVGARMSAARGVACFSLLLLLSSGKADAPSLHPHTLHRHHTALAVLHTPLSHHLPSSVSAPPASAALLTAGACGGAEAIPEGKPALKCRCARAILPLAEGEQRANKAAVCVTQLGVARPTNRSLVLTGERECGHSSCAVELEMEYDMYDNILTTF